MSDRGLLISVCGKEGRREGGRVGREKGRKEEEGRKGRKEGRK